jgi:hypothetical protein
MALLSRLGYTFLEDRLARHRLAHRPAHQALSRNRSVAIDAGGEIDHAEPVRARSH